MFLRTDEVLWPIFIKIIILHNNNDDIELGDEHNISKQHY